MTTVTAASASASAAGTSSTVIGSMALERLTDLPLDWKTILRQSQIHTVHELFKESYSEIDLMERLDLHLSEANQLLQLVGAQTMKPTTAYQLLKRDELPRLFLSDTIPQTRINPGITELCGPPGLGKTQYCFSLAAQAGLPIELGGLGGGTMWIDTEGAFATDRIVEISQSRYPHYFNQRDLIRQLVQSITVERISENEPHKGLVQKLRQIETVLLTQNIKLLVVDGIAATVRAQVADKERFAALSEIASQLKYLSENLGIAVVVTNQVTTKFVAVQNTMDGGVDGNVSSRVESHLVAALGTGWAHAVNTRFLLEDGGTGSGGGMGMGVGQGSNERIIKLAKSPMFPFIAWKYFIDEKGTQMDPQPLPTVGGVTSVLTQSMQNTTRNLTIGTRINQPLRQPQQQPMQPRS